MATVGIQLTYWSPRCADLRSTDPELWQHHYDQTPESVLTWLCDRLETRLDQIAMRAERHETTIWVRPAEGEPLRLMAVIFEGLTFDDMAVARARMLGRFIPKSSEKAG
jgi:hypothetical protein